MSMNWNDKVVAANTKRDQLELKAKRLLEQEVQDLNLEDFLGAIVTYHPAFQNSAEKKRNITTNSGDNQILTSRTYTLEKWYNGALDSTPIAITIEAYLQDEAVHLVRQIQLVSTLLGTTLEQVRDSLRQRYPGIHVTIGERFITIRLMSPIEQLLEDLFLKRIY